MTPEERTSALEAIADEVRVCQRCRLAQGRTRAVPGEGSPDTEVVFVGEGPGFNEDQQGRPFVGAAGSFLDELIGAVGWRRDEVFITNVVKCRPPGNRDPEPDEMAACAPFLRRQLEVLDPALVVTLGRFSLGTFMPGTRISQVHGTVRPADPATGARAARAFAMYHPAAALRATSLKETMRDDMSRIPQALIDARRDRPATGPAEEPQPSMTAVGASDPDPVPVVDLSPDAEEDPSAVDPGAEPMAATEVIEPVVAPEAIEAVALIVEPAPILESLEPVALAVEAGEATEAIPDTIEAIEAIEVLGSIDTLAALEVIGAPRDQPPETDQMQLFR